MGYSIGYDNKWREENVEEVEKMKKILKETK